jgi:glycosyltransferase involved in cell wall biosynthesis
MVDVSVALTVYNGSAYLREAVESILSQTYRDFEFIIVNNASTDETLPYLQSLKDPRIKLIHLETNQGQTRALNRAIQEASGRWVARMDADDLSMPERLAVQRGYLSTHPKAAVVGSWTDEIDNQGRHLKRMKYPTDPWEIRCHLLSDGDLTHRCLAHPSVMFLKKAVVEAGGYNEQVAYAQDYDLWTRLSRQHELHNVGQVLLNYRSLTGSTSRRNLDTMKQELDGIVSRNVVALYPDLSASDQARLVRMLRNQPPVEKETLPELFQLFNRFFERARLNWNISLETLRPYRETIKIYYIPQIFASNPLRAFVWTIQTLVRHPHLVLNSKWYKNIAKKILSLL